MPISNSANTLRSSEYRYRLTFQVKTEVKDTTGGITEIWTDDFTVWGSYEPNKSELLHTADKRFAESIALFRIRFQMGREINATRHRIVFASDPYSSPLGLSVWDIYPPLQTDGRYKELHIMARQYQ